MRPLSFYGKDFEKFLTRKNQEWIPPELVTFKANPIIWRSQVKIYDGMIENGRTRKGRTQKRAEELLRKACLPHRIEMKQKQKKLQKEEKRWKNKELKVIKKNYYSKPKTL